MNIHSWNERGIIYEKKLNYGRWEVLIVLPCLQDMHGGILCHLFIPNYCGEQDRVNNLQVRLL